MTSKTRRTAGIALLGILLSATLVHAGQSAGLKPIAFDDFIRVKRATDLQLSPDGTMIAFVITAMDKAANRGSSDIWTVPSRGGEPRRLTSSPAADMNPRWSPDGRTIAFISTRSGSPQVWTSTPRRRSGPAHAHLDRRVGRRLVALGHTPRLRLFCLPRLPG